MSIVIPLHTLYAFMAWTGTTLPLPYSFVLNSEGFIDGGIIYVVCDPFVDGLSAV
jgi:hypothetical protein